MQNIKGGFLSMILSILGIVLFVTMFSSVMTAMTTLFATDGVSDFIAFETVLGITPTVLFLGGIFAGAFIYYKGYKSVGDKGGDTGGLMRMVLGILIIILFVTMFATIVSSMKTLYDAYSSNATWIAFGTVVSIAPTVLFLAGVFAGGATSYGGYKARKRRRSLR